MCISGGKSSFSYDKAAWLPRFSGGLLPTTRGWSTTSAQGANHGIPWSTKSAPSSPAKAAHSQASGRLQERLLALCPPRAPMSRMKRERMRPTAGERFCRALAMVIAAWGEEESPLPFVHRMELMAEHDWSSATFVGVRARVLLSYAPVSVDAEQALAARLTAANFALGAYLVADLTADPRTGGMMVEVLLLEAH